VKRQLEEIRDKSVKTTIHFLRWIFFIIFIYIAFTIAYGLWLKGAEFFETVVNFSVGGFFAFFMGYFGWRLAEVIEDWLRKKEK
jgi:hypothetical protein